MERPVQQPSPWFRDPRLLLASAAGVAAIAVAGAAVGIASARTNHPAVQAPISSGMLSVVMQAPREPGAPDTSPERLATLDPAALRAQAAVAPASDPEGDENLKIIDAQERRLQALNAREAAAFAEQMRQTETEDRITAETSTRAEPRS